MKGYTEECLSEGCGWVLAAIIIVAMLVFRSCSKPAVDTKMPGVVDSAGNGTVGADVTADERADGAFGL